MKTEKNNEQVVTLRLNIAKRVAIVVAILAVILSVLMIVNYIQTTTVNPLDSKALNELMLQLQKNPEDTALREQIRALDLLARKAYFTHQWQVRTGSFMLFVFVLVFLIALKYMRSLRAQLPDLSRIPDSESSWESAVLARKAIIFGGLGLFIIAFFVGILSESALLKIGIASARVDASTKSIPTLKEIREQWPGFRGPEGIGIAYQSDIPTDWDGPSNRNILWKTQIPKAGFSSPIVWKDKIFLSGADEDSQQIYCIDATSGDILWTASADDIPGSPARRPNISEDTGYAASTMTTDGSRIFAIFATGDIGCWDFDGNRIWAKNMGMPDNHYGHASSLAVSRDLVLIQFDQNTGGHLIALKTDSGDLVYDKDRNVEISWASPIVVNTGRRTEIILSSNPYVISYDPMTGQELWRVACMMGEVAPSPAYADGMVYAVNEYARLAAIQLGDTAKIVWAYDDDLAEVSSPLATKDFVIVAASYGTVSCFNSKTGERYWFHDFDEGFYSSPILVDDRVYLIDMMGIMVIFKAEKEFQLINQCALGERAVTIPAFMHQRIVIRGERHLFCIGN
ncbi:MAG: PQQ-binding-like beta-propeller repeat protein [bacterium]